MHASEKGAPSWPLVLPVLLGMPFACAMAAWSLLLMPSHCVCGHTMSGVCASCFVPGVHHQEAEVKALCAHIMAN